jgi:putative MATE family efflux protein
MLTPSSPPNLFRRFIDFYADRDYYRQMFRLMWPLVLQNLINSSLNMVNTVMIGQNGETSVAAVALAGQIFFLLNLVIFGIGSGSAMFTAQLWGKHDVPNIRRVLGLCLTLGLISAGIFLFIAEVFPAQALALYTTDPNVLALGSEYLRIYGWSFIFFTISFSYALVLRSVGEVRAPVAISIASLVLNALLSYILIFGALGLPALGVKGAAWAFLISRMLECVVLIVVTYRSNSPIAATLGEMLNFDLDFMVRVLKPVLPVALNELLWALGTTSYSAIYARIGTDSIAAINIVSAIEMVAYILFWAMNGATAVLVGNAIGAGDEETAYRHGGRSLGLVMVGSMLVGALAYFSSGIVLSWYKVSPQVITNAQNILLVSCSLFWVRAMNGVNIVSIMRAGGDTRFALILDGLIIWIVGVPLAWLGAFGFHFPVHLVYLCAMAEEIVKWIFGIQRYFSRKWIHNLTTQV